MGQYYIGLCVIDELDGSQVVVEIPLEVWTDDEAKAVFGEWKAKHSEQYDGRSIVGEPVLYFLRRVA